MHDPSSSPMVAAASDAGLHEPEDFALGFECADPSLQIERWPDESELAAESA